MKLVQFSESPPPDVLWRPEGKDISLLIAHGQQDFIVVLEHSLDMYCSLSCGYPGIKPLIRRKAPLLVQFLDAETKFGIIFCLLFNCSNALLPIVYTPLSQLVLLGFYIIAWTQEKNPS